MRRGGASRARARDLETGARGLRARLQLVEGRHDEGLRALGPGRIEDTGGFDAWFAHRLRASQQGRHPRGRDSALGLEHDSPFLDRGHLETSPQRVGLRPRPAA